jgi:CMP-N,N'-diacetyllegionaminic acid synthase|tara:strand:- start:7928 stop:8641 length:714 start_codon:yes stop_codon:yes gene_type:complete
MESGKLNKIICVIPARSGSKGLKNKNILHLSNEPLIARVIKYALRSKKIDEVVVSTDSSKIAKIANKYGAKTPFIRPKKLAKDLTTTEDTLKHALLECEKIFNLKYDICIYLSPTDIFRSPNWIDLSIDKLIKNQKLESVFVGYETHKNFWEFNKGRWSLLKPWMKVYSSRQVRKKIVREDTGLCCASRASLWRKGKRIGSNVDIIINKNDLSFVDIHEKRDLKLANLIIKNKIDKT